MSYAANWPPSGSSFTPIDGPAAGADAAVLTVLLTNLTMDLPSGTVVYTRDLALELRRLGHRPIVYTWIRGAASRELESAGIEVVDGLWRIHSRPNVIHGHHRPLVRGALLRFPDVPAVVCCHNPTDPWDAPKPDPQIRRYFGVSELCAQRFVVLGAPPAATEIRPNFVDLNRFTPRPPLPERPTKALVFSNYATAETHLPAIQRAAERLGLPLDVIGRGVGRPSDHPEQLLPAYDIVFAVGKAALEAMAVGAAVVVCDRPGLGPMVTAGLFPSLRRKNFGLAALVDPVTENGIERAVALYDASEAARVRDIVRAECGLEGATAGLVAVYRRVIEEAAAAAADGGGRQPSRRSLAIARYRISTAPTAAFYRTFGLGPRTIPAPMRPAYRLARSAVRRVLGVG
jgi:hypothetical protein